MSDWVTWTIFFAVGLAVFAVIEYRALTSNDPRRVTLSRYLYTIGSRFPLSILMMGMLIGGLGVHLFWHWAPDCLQWAPNSPHGG